VAEDRPLQYPVGPGPDDERDFRSIQLAQRRGLEPLTPLSSAAPLIGTFCIGNLMRE
jgi:hypothetical protein